MQEAGKVYEGFIKGKELNNNNRELFESVIKKSIKAIKRHGSK